MKTVSPPASKRAPKMTTATPTPRRFVGRGGSVGSSTGSRSRRTLRGLLAGRDSDRLGGGAGGADDGRRVGAAGPFAAARPAVNTFWHPRQRTGFPDTSWADCKVAPQRGQSYWWTGMAASGRRE